MAGIEREVGIKITVEGTQEQVDALDSVNESLKVFSEQKKQLNKQFKDQTISAKSYAESLTAIESETRKLRNTKREHIKSIDQEKAKTREVSGSYVSMNRELVGLRKSYKELSKAEREGAKGKEMLNKIQDLDTGLKNIDKGIGQYQRNVGNYGQAVEGLASHFGLMNGNLGQIAKSFQLLTTATKTQTAATATSVTGLKAFRVALMSTGIGAVVVAVGSLASFLTSTKKGMEIVERASATLGAVFNVFRDRASTLGETLFETFSNPKQAVMDLWGAIQQNLLSRMKAVPTFFTAVGQVIKSSLSLEFDEAKKSAEDAGSAFLTITTGGMIEGVKQLGQGVKELASETIREAKAANDLTGAMQKLRDAQRQVNVDTAEMRTEQKALLLIAEDQTRSVDERTRAAVEAFALEDKVFQQRVANAEEEVRIMEAQEAMSESTAEDLDRTAQARINLSKIQEESLERQTTINNKLNEINRQAAAQEQKRIDEAKKAEEAEEATRLKIIADRNEAELLAIQEKYNNEIIAAKGNKDQIAKIEREKKTEILNITKETLTGIMQEIEGQLLTASAGDLILSDEDRAQLELRLAKVKAELSEVGVSLNQVNTNEEGEKETLIDKLGMSEEGMEVAMVALQTTSELVGIIGGMMAQKTQEKIANLEEEKQAEIDHVNQTVTNEEERNTKIAEIESKHAAKKMAIEKKEKKRQKKMALITAAINGAMAIMQAIANFGPPPSPAGIAGIVAAGVLTAANIAAISAQKYEAGGLITGPSHSAGGVPFTVAGVGGFEAEGGEYIINKNAVESIGLPYLESLNSVGRPSRSSVAGHFAAGGRVDLPQVSLPQGVQQTAAVIQESNEELVRAFDERIDRMQVSVLESEITGTQIKVAEVEEVVSFG